MDALRDLPSVDQVVRKLRRTVGLPQAVITAEVRAELSSRREALLAGSHSDAVTVEEAVEARLERLTKPSLRRLINATGVILHTNLGRAPLAAFDPLPGYSNLEFDLAAGKRGKRDEHISALIERVLCKPAIVVNNNAGAVFLVLNELASGGEVIVSRGELIEIGDGFRIPEIMARSGAILREVGTTNRTRIDDYRRAISEKTALILRVHRSNFRMSGFTERPALADLVQLGREHNLPVYEDLGSGCLMDLRRFGIDEPLVSDSLRAGVGLVSFSGDKLLGGPQSGIIAGNVELVRRVRRNPLYRAFRVDKLTIQALATTLLHVLREDWNAIPALRMITTPLEEIRCRAERVAAQISGMIVEGKSAIGGGSTPAVTLPTWVVELSVENPDDFSARLRQAEMPVIARIERDKIVLDMRTVADEEVESLIATIRQISQLTKS
ncbi:MAG: L-seryl-tRNA(Sec) selenium transferase [Bryobacteraceae bacterium]